MKKNICFISLGNIYLAPYLKTYTNLIENYSIIYWDRENLDENLDNAKVYRFTKANKSKIDKIIGYIQFRRYATRLLKKNNYDCLIFLQTLGSILLSKIITKKYKKKYIVDIRDYSYEGNKLIFHIEKKVIQNSYKCVLSSEGYKDFLPESDYLITHNRRELPFCNVERIKNRMKNRKTINIAFIGYVNYQDQHKKLLLSLKNDNRFVISFIGTKALELKDFCEKNGITNVILQDRFDSSRILDFYQNADFVNNLYGNHTPTLDYALSNKLYFAAELNIPILVFEDTFMSRVAEKYQFGLTISTINNQIGDLIWAYYNSIDWDVFSNHCAGFMEKVTSEQKIFEKEIAAILV